MCPWSRPTLTLLVVRVEPPLLLCSFKSVKWMAMSWYKVSKSNRGIHKGKVTLVVFYPEWWNKSSAVPDCLSRTVSITASVVVSGSFVFKQYMFLLLQWYIPESYPHVLIIFSGIIIYQCELKVHVGVSGPLYLLHCHQAYTVWFLLSHICMCTPVL